MQTVSLRERKKEMARKAMIDVATALFDQRGFNNVTVAEIADAANVSVKTLFTYFGSKEDLVFGDENSLRDQIIECIKTRKPGESVLEAVTALLQSLITPPAKGSVLAILKGFKMMTDQPSLQARLRTMWDRYEDAIAETLAEETNCSPHDPRPRIAAAQLVAIIRCLTSEHVRRHLETQKASEQTAAYKSWLKSSSAMVRDGLGDYARRAKK